MVEIPRKLSQVRYVVIVYNILEAALAVCFGILAQSIALIGFGLISTIESYEDFMAVKQFYSDFSESSGTVGSHLKKPMVSVAIFSFFGGTWALIQSIKLLILKTPPLTSFAGIIIALCSLLIMPLLAYWIYCNHDSAKLDAMRMGLNEIWAYMLLSLGLLSGLCLNYFFGFWKADPFVGLIVSGFLYKKSFDNIINKWEETDKCEAPPDEYNNSKDVHDATVKRL